ncbi:hypothetical protein BST85_03710 [Aureitalea marina]|uniref:DUF4397 domain-containing protein n=2 Tax=Aureitalea marina TaxID=930804 RepID=A0A2S7KNA0_9FLAO|nr:hypothetical protein BST85_03710 [Aureitalea marina]
MGIVGLAQTADVQIIHNSADAAASTVDIYVDGNLALNDFAFRTATPFIPLDADVQIEIAVAPGDSDSVMDAIATFPVTLTSGETYVVVADGIVDTPNYNPAPGFNLEIYDMGQQAAGDPMNTDVLVHHGSTDAPTVDIVEVGAGAGTIVNDLSYTDFQGYLPLPTADYALEVRDQTGTVTVAAYEAPLATLGLDGAAVVAVASGFLNPAVNSDGPAFGVFVATPAGGPLVELPTSTARVQVIHNSADLAATQVDVYLGDTRIIDDFEFRTASPYVDLPAGVGINIGIANGGSASSADVFANFPLTLTRNETYSVVADGIISTGSYNPSPSFGLEIFAGAREAATDPSRVDVLIHHGSTDAPTVDIFETLIGVGLIANDLSYTDFRSSYLELPNLNYAIEVRDETGTATVAAYDLPIADLGIEGLGVTAVASGFLDPSNNLDGPAFGIFVALPAGGPLVELPTSTARVQVIHNSADAAAEQVDVYIDGALALDNFTFRNATPFIDLNAGVTTEIAIAPAASTDVSEAIATFPVVLAVDETYVVVADGIVSPTGYDPAPAFGLEVYDMGREVASDPTQIDLLVHHGSTDAPTVDIVEVGVGAGTIVDDLAYTEFQGYLELDSNDYALEVRDETGTVTVAAYEAPLASLGLDGGAAVAVASGFLNPANNSDGAAFGIWVALPTGGEMIPLPISTARLQVIHNSADLAASEVDVYIGGALALDGFAFRTATPFIDFPSSIPVDIAVAPGNSTDVGDAIATFPVTLTRNGTFVVVADGIVSETGYDPAPAFGLEVYSAGREEASDPANTDVLVHHGSTDAPTVDVVEVGVGAGTIVDDLAYTDFQGYLELPTDDYIIEVRDETGTATVASYGAPLETLGLNGAAITVVASGFLNPANNSDGPAFGLWVALEAGGDLIELPTETLSTDDFQVNELAIYPNPATNLINIRGLNAAGVTIQMVDLQGRTVLEANLDANSQIDVSNLSAGLYQMVIRNGNQVLGSRKLIKR